DDHRLAAADVQAGDRVLVGHAARQAQDVVQRLLLGLVRPHAGAAQRRAQHGVVDRDDGLQARVLVVAEDDLFVAEGVQLFEDHRQTPLHGADPLARDAGNVWKRGGALAGSGRTGKGRHGGAAFYASRVTKARPRRYGVKPRGPVKLNGVARKPAEV